MSEVLENMTEETQVGIDAAQAAQEQLQAAQEQMIEDENPVAAKRRKWSSFVEGPAADFFTGYKLEKMTIDDGNGNKAKFSRTKDEGIKVEYTSAVLL